MLQLFAKSHPTTFKLTQIKAYTLIVLEPQLKLTVVWADNFLIGKNLPDIE